MFYNLLYQLHGFSTFFNLFRYITFRSAMAALTAFIISLACGPFLIKKMRQLKVGEKINKGDSEELDRRHGSKKDTPTMGGILVLGAVVISTLLWADIFNSYIHMVLFSTIWLGVTGFFDDYLKQVKKKAKGLPASVKFTSQIVLGLILGTILLNSGHNIALDVPFLKNVSINLDGFYILFVMLVISGSSNAVNLTDGLDGLAIGIVVMVALTFAVLSYVSGNINFSEYLLIPFIKGSGELTVFCASILGAGLGFLWFNCYPASIFMGDVGSLALGGAIGTIAIILKKEMLLLIVGGIFVIEALSVILQVCSFKLTGKRIFKIAPLHHHFEFLHWPENKVIVRFWIIASFLAVLTIITLKLR